MSSRMPLARVLFHRLRQHGVHHLFGVPGDFTLKALDHAKAAGIKWIGNCNELNAGYAADGYARVNGLGAVFTTYGVGELSAINAIAGGYAEHVPVIHIAGLPRSQHVLSDAVVHHTLGDGRPMVFREMYEKVTVAQTLLTHDDQQNDPVNLIDRTIEEALRYSQPAYIGLPCDMINTPVDLNARTRELDLSEGFESETLSMAEDIWKRLQLAKKPLLLVDRGHGMDQLRNELNEFVRCSGIPTLTMPSGAGMIDHRTPNYYGVHAGPVGQIDTMPYLKSSDLVLAFGPMYADTQTLGWSVVPPPSKAITIRKNCTQILGNRFIATNARELLRLLTVKTRQAGPLSFDIVSLSQSDFRHISPIKSRDKTEKIHQTDLYLRLNNYLRPHDTIFLGNATPILGGRDFVLPDPSCRVIASGMWFSIGHMLPAALGAALAQQRSSLRPPESKNGRIVLFDGDGSFQVTAQELSTIIHQRLNVTVFIINNEGYAYERLIHNPEEDYHDIAPWKFLSLPKAFGSEEALKQAEKAGEEYSVDTLTLRTWDDVDAFLKDVRFDNGYQGKGKKGLKLIDVKVGRTDVPEKFRGVFESAGNNLG